MNKVKHCLLIWEIVPEETILYMIPCEQMYEHFSKNELKLIHKQYIGHMNSDEVSLILNRLNEQIENWKDYRLDTFLDLEISNDQIEIVACTGFIL